MPLDEYDTWALRHHCTVRSPKPDGASAVPSKWKLHDPYPNPGADVVDLLFDAAEPCTWRLIVIDAAGRMVLTREGRSDAAQRGFLRMDVSQFPAGAYIIRFEARAASGPPVFEAAKPLVVQR